MMSYLIGRKKPCNNTLMIIRTCLCPLDGVVFVGDSLQINILKLHTKKACLIVFCFEKCFVWSQWLKYLAPYCRSDKPLVGVLSVDMFTPFMQLCLNSCLYCGLVFVCLGLSSGCECTGWWRAPLQWWTMAQHHSNKARGRGNNRCKQSIQR